MKRTIASITMALCGTLVLTVGCKKQEEAAPPAQATESSKGLSTQAAEAVDAVKTTANEVTTQAASQLTAAQQQAQGLLDKAKGFIAEKKYQDALSTLNGLANVKLTPEQQNRFDDLKAQVQTALAKLGTSGSNVGSGLSGILGGKK